MFNKDEATLVYAVVGLKNVHWPGWLTIGYVIGGLFRKMDGAVFMLGMG